VSVVCGGGGNGVCQWLVVVGGGKGEWGVSVVCGS